MTLPAAFLTAPIAHRALHGPGAPENSMAAVRAAIAAGYGIEIDLQLSADGHAIVFHDYDLDRLTGETGPLRARAASDLEAIRLKGGDGGIPTFEQVLSAVAGQVPLLVEIKDQDGALGDDLGPLEQAAATAVVGYDGPLAFMSFNPNSVARMAVLAPGVPRGLTTCAYDSAEWPLSDARREALRQIPDAARVGASFISHDRRALDMPAVAALKAQGLPILCWTVRSPEQEAQARHVADNITFEGYRAPIPA